MEKSLNRNILILHIFKVLRYFMVMMPIIVPFFQSKNLSQTQIFLLESAVALGIIIFELPSGKFADTFGRKNSLIIGSSFASLALLIYNFASSFGIFFIANLILGIGYSFISGADNAIAYDSHKSLNREKEFLRYEARLTSSSRISQIVASFCGAALAAINLKYPILGQLFAFLALILVALFLKETPHLEKKSPKDPVTFFKIFKKLFSQKNDLKWLILYFSLLGNMTHTLVWIIQPFYQRLNIEIKWFGLLWALQYLLFSLSSRIFYKFTIGKKQNHILVVLFFLAVLSYIFVSILDSYLSLFFIFSLFIIQGCFKPLIVQMINERSNSSTRAAIFSLENLIKKFFYLFLGPLIGLSLDLESVTFSFLFSGILYFALGFYVVYKVSKLI